MDAGQSAVILIVEGEGGSGGEIARMLEAPDYRLLTASTAEEARRVGEETRLDLVIMDVGSPDTDGVALARTLKGEPPAAQPPVIFVSTEVGAAAEGIAEVADAYLSAPVAPAVLRLNVQAVLRLHTAEENRLRVFRLLRTLEGAFRWWLAYFNRDLAFAHVNQAFCEAVGRRPEELLGRPYTEVLPEGEIVARRLRRVRETGRPTRLREVPQRALTGRKRGPTRYLDITFVAVRDETGVVEGVALSALDVTAEIQLRAVRAQEERRRRELAEAMNQEINHRVKNNLTMAAEMLYLQAQGLRDERARSALNDAVMRLNVLGRIHEELQAVETQEVDLLALLQRVADVSRSTVPERDVEISVHDEPVSLPTQAATNLSLAANELITNGIKHGAPGRDGRLRIVVWLTRHVGRIGILVWSSGNPIPADFDTIGQGGMGLYLIQAIAVAHYGGSFDMCSDAGGTVAQILISESALRAE